MFARQGDLRRAPLLSLLLALVAGSAGNQETTLQSNVVLVPALVKSPRGAIVYGLQGKDFIVEDDGVERAVRLEESPESQPISLAVAIPSGRRASYEFRRIRGLRSIVEPIVSERHARSHR